MTLIPFSQALRERTWASHGESEGAGFMTNLMKGEGTLDDYTQLVVQHFFIYEVLEEIAAAKASDPDASALFSAELVRMPAIEADLDHLMGEGWRDRISPVPATVRYCERMREVADWTGGVIAHHYTRYLGDLSGGQHIGKLMQRHFGLGAEGVAFYSFAEIESPAEFKDAYRAALDSIEWTEEERGRVIDEVLVAYQFNTDLFFDLDAQKAATAAA
ncbi:heme oxygenase (biliverdin-producing) [Salinibacterium hongtaonis]|uniref:Biliverdin-producing heme oxygenase n=1 Tax=Homoserinimonas hongtaonis TaxID=2079791 RepID=A0A2U1T1W6_9MICO|nr:biliverdin-producing heme oxygenase [Salinibacterium hongtaonis]AWB90400.1 biliverdin-producing heme oxygenase [Salinibacterium hongtaonis]PWB97840.1 biliverdin-producing heme oxygenase [Salinibacterium hongtaonis]